MLTARIAYSCMTILIVVVNGAALLALWRANQAIDPVVPAALILSLVGWPLRLSALPMARATREVCSASREATQLGRMPRSIGDSRCPVGSDTHSAQNVTRNARARF